MSYTGRFAPSPTGPLHFGSLLAALASYLDAKSQQGQWLVRIENLDPPREVPGAADSILRTLDRFGFEWDQTVVFQSDREDYYRSILQQLIERKLAYPCSCSRTALKARKAFEQYDQHCLKYPPDPALPLAIRARITEQRLHFKDRIQGAQTADPSELGDFIIFRRDQLFAYQLAVVADDIAQGVNHIVRGADLLRETFAQIQLYQHLNLPTPSYAHIPLALTSQGQKLSKQNLAPSIEQLPIVETLTQALLFLGQQVPENALSFTKESLLEWAISNWRLEGVPKTTAVLTGS